jgi:type I restriction enzyme, S subunit
MLLKVWDMIFRRLGDFIQLVDNRNSNLEVTNLKGVSTKKILIESVANTDNVSFHNYKILEKDQFVYVADTSRRGEKIGLAKNNSADCIVSSIYTTFEIIDQDRLLPDYLFMWFNRPDFNRYARFHSWGSARETFDWNSFCEIKMPIPDIKIQQKYVGIYKAMLSNQKIYENTINDLNLVCNNYIENLIQSTKPKILGDYIELVDERNSNNEINRVRGVSNTKTDIPTKANMSDVDISSYKIVNKNHFVFAATTSRMGDKICLALNHNEPFVASKTYPVFKVKKTSGLLSDYLYLWFARSEFDRYARYHSWGSVREAFNWSDMCRVELPIPNIEVQQAIVDIYYVLQSRIKINDQLKNAINEICPVLMKGVVENDAIH